MDNKSTTKRMIGAVVLVLIAALLLAWLLKGKNKSVQQQQDLIAEQTNQGSTKILGFPGVQEGDQATQDGEQVAQDGEAPYVIGDATQQTGDADTTQQAQTTEQQQVADAGQATDGTGTGVAATVGGAAAGAVTAGKEAVKKLADNFDVRDSGSDSDGQRQVVADGEAKNGVGSMGSSEISLPKQSETTTASAGGDATQQQTQAAQQADEKTSADQTQTASTGSATQEQPATQKKASPNVKLVGEKPVPAPRSQSSQRNTASAAAKKVTTTAAKSSSQSTSAGGKGYAIQVLAASSRNKAEQVRKSISVDGYPVFVVKANVNGKTVYRVRVGTYPARNAARAVQTKMKARYTKNQYVQNSFVTKN